MSWPEESHPRLLAGRIGDWRASLGRSLCSPLTRSFVLRVSQHLDHATFPDCAPIPLSCPGGSSCPPGFDLGVRCAAASVGSAQALLDATPILPPNSSAGRSRWWPCWREALTVIQPETVLRWRRRGIAAIWKHRSHGRWQGGRPRDRRRDPLADPRDGPREFPLGYTMHPRRTAETRHHHLADHCITLHAGLHGGIGGRNADFSAEPRCRDCSRPDPRRAPLG